MPGLTGLYGGFVSTMPDSRTVAAAFHQKAEEYDRHVLVQKRVVAQLAESVAQHCTAKPKRILDVGTGTGALLERLNVIYPDAALTGVDIAINMCQRTQRKLGDICNTVTADAESLPLESGTFDLVVSASMLQWVGNLSAALNEMYRVTRPGGDISLAFFCEGTLAEMHQCFRETVVRSHGDSGRIGSRLHTFRSVDEVMPILNGMNFDSMVVTVETEVDWYDDLYSLLRSIKNIGAGATVTAGSGNGLGWRGVLQEASRIYNEKYGQNGSIPATYKVFYLSARKK